MERLGKVQTRLKEHGVKIKKEKCHFLKEKVMYLGYQISAEGFSTDPDKVAAVENWKVPNTVKELKSFLGFASYYRKFAEDFSKITGTLHELVNQCLHEIKLKKPFTSSFENRWDEDYQKAFDDLK